MLIEPKTECREPTPRADRTDTRANMAGPRRGSSVGESTRLISAGSAVQIRPPAQFGRGGREGRVGRGGRVRRGGRGGPVSRGGPGSRGGRGGRVRRGGR